MTNKAKLEANKRYQATQESIVLRVPKGTRERIKQASIDRTFQSTQSYIKYLIRKDSGLNL